MAISTNNHQFRPNPMGWKADLFRKGLPIVAGIIAILASIGAAGYLFPVLQDKTIWIVLGGTVAAAFFFVFFQIKSKKANKQVYQLTEIHNKFTSKEMELARSYRGQRQKLKLQVLQGEVHKRILDAHLQDMFDNRQTVQGFLWKVEKEGRSLYLIGTSDIRLYDPKNDPSFNSYSSSLSLYAEKAWHPMIIEKMKQTKELYVELDHTNPQILWDLSEVNLPAYSYSGQTELLEVMQTESLTIPSVFRTLHKNSSVGVYSFETVESMKNTAETSSKHVNLDAALDYLDAVQWGLWSQVETFYTNLSEIDRNAMVDSRNEHIAKKILDVLETNQSPLFAIGSYHFAGSSGIIQRLEQVGVSITRV